MRLGNSPDQHRCVKIDEYLLSYSSLKLINKCNQSPCHCLRARVGIGKKNHTFIFTRHNDSCSSMDLGTGHWAPGVTATHMLHEALHLNFLMADLKDNRSGCCTACTQGRIRILYPNFLKYREVLGKFFKRFALETSDKIPYCLCSHNVPGKILKGWAKTMLWVHPGPTWLVIMHKYDWLVSCAFHRNVLWTPT